jgi:hypothetical protein
MPDSELEKIKRIDEQAPFFYEFGKFISLFSMIETFAHVVFRYVANLDDKKSRAIIGGMRLIDVTGILLRLTELSEADIKKKTELRVLLNQLNAIATLRHALIHRGATVIGSQITSMNSLTAKTVESIEELTFELEDIKSATSDLTRIGFRLWLFIGLKPALTDDDSKEIFSPWRYKSVQPSTPGKPPPPKRQKPSHPPQSSRG